MKDNFNLEIDVQEPPVIAVRLANLLFFLGFIISALIVLYVTYKIINPANVLLNNSVAYISSDYNTGYMTGDIKGAWLSDTDATDLSGTELVSNGGFDTDTTGWTLSNITAVVTSGEVLLDDISPYQSSITQTITTVVGKTYSMVIKVNAAPWSYYIYADSRLLGTATANGIHHFNFVARTTSTAVKVNSGSGIDRGTTNIDSISVRPADIDRSVNGYDNYPSNTRDYIYLIIAVITSSIFALGAILRNHLKVNLSILFLTTGLALYSIELYLTLSFNNDHKNYILDAQEKNDSKWDHRNLYEVIEDLKKSTNDNSIYPHYNSGGLIFTSYLQNLIDDKELDRIRVEANGLHPLSNNSNSTIVHCNENGIWHNFKTDKYGFSNPAKIIQNINAINITLIGDSFAEAHCVPQGEDIGYKLRDLGFNINNLGKAAGGVIHYNAIYREYGKPNLDFIPDYVVMFLYYQNDLADTYKEYFNPVYQKYIDNESYSQGLINKQNKVNKLKKEYFELVSNPRFLEKHPELSNARYHPALISEEYLSSKKISSFIKLKRLREPFENFTDKLVNKFDSELNILKVTDQENMFVIVDHPDTGGLYEGEFKDGIPNGKGKITRPNGDIYEGEMKDGKRDGYGIFYEYSTNTLWEGTWHQGFHNNLTKTGTSHHNAGLMGKIIDGQWKDQEVIFQHIQMINDEISKDAKFIVVYLPMYGEIKDKNYKNSNLVTKKLTELQITNINMADVFKSYDMSEIYYDKEVSGHYSSNGYGIIAKEIDKKINEDVSASNNSNKVN